jgi:hypothetical protein
VKPTGIFTGILFFLSAVVANSALAQTTGSRVFLLEDAEHHQWCAYGSESEWTSEVKSLTAMVVATLEYSGDHVSKIGGWPSLISRPFFPDPKLGVPRPCDFCKGGYDAADTM